MIASKQIRFFFRIINSTGKVNDVNDRFWFSDFTPKDTKIIKERLSVECSFFNLKGQELLKQLILKPETQVDISYLLADIYMVMVRNDRTMQVEKFVRQ